MMQGKQIVFLGAGSMAEAMIRGLLANQLVEPNQITVLNRTNAERLKELQQQYGVTASQDLDSCISRASVVVMAVKPKDAEEIFARISSLIDHSPLLLSVIAGLSTETMTHWTSKNTKVVRVMPNTSSAISMSTTGYCTGKAVSTEDKAIVHSLLSGFGTAYEIEEAKMNLFTGLAGSSPAYMYAVMEYFEDTAKAHGFTEEEGRQWIVDVMAGAAEMVRQTNRTPAELRAQVTSPKGTTYEGLARLEAGQAKDVFREAIEASAEKAQEFEEAFKQTTKSKA
ncbi:pyrroline-5-carboxylate reductase [Aureibacillus halotolerans]|uniref:Pyrroline-5-carboxylate reductase n=1 Tax=Aureibacillus halotolerans TaxID=1508390 RepID=A0A4R6U7C6_9BACI|nr:pyrroline-5-carboxylate reductase [Aureibacillus halotolerans]TDQ42241.1 pyrroline-5-carboxylate reductase [Aureibacillus halotolerans]